jgi:hypothetical protein
MVAVLEIEIPPEQERLGITDLVMCGTFHPDVEVHARAMLMRQETPDDGVIYRDSTGCGRLMHWTYAYRCVDCGIWFHQDCLLNHFKANIEAPY